MWGVYLKPFSLTRRASKHFSLRWKASSRSSCHISSFLAKLTSTISRWGVYVKDFFLSPISLFHSYTPLPHPGPAAPLLSSSANMSLPRSPHLLRALYNSLSVSLKMFESHYHSFQSLHLTFFKLSPRLPHVCAYVWAHSFTFEVFICSSSSHGFQLADVKKEKKVTWTCTVCFSIAIMLVIYRSFYYTLLNLFLPTAVI